MQLTLQTYLLVCPLIFLAGFIDSIAGGGGLISLPAYLLAGLPPRMAAGTNKMGAFAGTAVATLKYARSGQIAWREGIAAALGALPGSYLGAALLQIIDERYVMIGVVAAMPLVAAFVLLRKDSLEPRSLVPAHMKLFACFLIGLLIGTYDGLVGPGTGTFLQLLFVSVVGLAALKASGAARLVNLCSNVGALISLISGGKVLYALALPAAAFGMAGNYLGSSLAIKKGSRLIRLLLIVVLVLLMGTLIYRLIS